MNPTRKPAATSAGETQTTPPLDTLKILILQRRNDVLDALEDYYKKIEAGSGAPKHFILSRIRVLFLDVEHMLRRYFGKDSQNFKELSAAVMSDSLYNSINAFREINRILDEKNLTRFDTNEKSDTSRVEIENTIKGL